MELLVHDMQLELIDTEDRSEAGAQIIKICWV